ncbi:nitroreductase family deazaflavin-dependent oxidoreductase [Agromyces bracchium]|uniref:nitroreductase family deazaflavin-dependent oxidoreductase n=1 Tax=Agromyces bracchium TaxID=88376 RepID=UPI002E20C38F
MPTVLQLTRSIVAPITRTRLFRRIAPIVLPTVEAVLGALSGGRLQLASLLVPSLVLHTVGARTGMTRDVHLMYTPDGRGRAIIAGTSFARDRHPGWTYNLLANPDASITVRDRTLLVHASPIPATERDAAWARIEAQWPGYRGYERDSGRIVRLFLLRPVAEPAGPHDGGVAAGDGPLDASSDRD